MFEAEAKASFTWGSEHMLEFRINKLQSIMLPNMFFR